MEIRCEQCGGFSFKVSLGGAFRELTLRSEERCDMGAALPAGPAEAADQACQTRAAL